MAADATAKMRFVLWIMTCNSSVAVEFCAVSDTADPAVHPASDQLPQSRSVNVLLPTVGGHAIVKTLGFVRPDA